MRKSFFALFIAGLVAASAGSAFAQDDDEKSGDAKSGSGKVKRYDFDGDTIDGDLIRPEGTTVSARDGADYGSLIRIRKDFIPEIIKSAEDL